MVSRFPGFGLIPKFLQNGKGGTGKALSKVSSAWIPTILTLKPLSQRSASGKARTMRPRNATFSSGQSALGEMITPGRAPNEPRCLYEPLFPLLMDQLSFTKSCFCKARGKNTFENTESRPRAVRAPGERCENPAVIYPGQLYRNVFMDKSARCLLRSLMPVNFAVEFSLWG